VPRTLRFLFTLEGRVSRQAYALTGVALMALKYAVEVVAVWQLAGASWTPFEYFVPIHALRADSLAGAPEWFLPALALWTLPFAWIGAAMTVRRARDAGLGSWAVVPFFAPVWNYAWMLYLAVRAPRPAEESRGAHGAHGARGESDPIATALIAVGTTALAATLLVAFTTLVARSYGGVLFVGLPFAIGIQVGFLLNRGGDRGSGATLQLALVALALAAMFLLLFALEGIVCILMGAVPALPATLLGSVIGRALALTGRRARAAVLPVLLVPPLAWIEARASEPAVFEVVTATEVDAPPARVFEHVVAFSELPPPEHWLFATGIAYPVRARIDGTGAGAMRRCEFSTGAFVEPITAWEPPLRLAFDVVAQPDAMEEWSFYARVRPPHLGHSFRALRGEFRLAPLPGGRTRLEGSTWYALDLAPRAYWRLVADAIVHRIHGRVLAHVRSLAEAPSTPGSGGDGQQGDSQR
jgi:uncharacterized membrane protein YhaH (DUF805 family)